MVAVDEALKRKILRRSARAFKIFDEGGSKKTHRITEVTATTLRYRIRPASGEGRHGGKKVLVRRVEGEVDLAAPDPKGLLDLVDNALLEELKAHQAKVRAYKLTDKDATGPIFPGLIYKVGEIVEAKDVDKNADKECAEGINVGSLEWCKAHFKHTDYPKGERIFAVEFDAKEDLAVIPKSTKHHGKFRIHRCKVVEELDLVELGLVEGAKKARSKKTDSKADVKPIPLPIADAPTKSKKESIIARAMKKISRKKSK